MASSPELSCESSDFEDVDIACELRDQDKPASEIKPYQFEPSASSSEEDSSHCDDEADDQASTLRRGNTDWCVPRVELFTS